MLPPLACARGCWLLTAAGPSARPWTSSSSFRAPAARSIHLPLGLTHIAAAHSDYARLFDGPSVGAPQIGPSFEGDQFGCTGSGSAQTCALDEPLDQVTTGTVMHIQFVSDNHYTPVPPPPPPPPGQPPPPPPPGFNPNGFTAVVACPGGQLQQTCEACAPGQYDHDSNDATECEYCERRNSLLLPCLLC